MIISPTAVQGNGSRESGSSLVYLDPARHAHFNPTLKNKGVHYSKYTYFINIFIKFYRLTGKPIQPFAKDYYTKQKDIPLQYSNEISENRSQGSGRRVIVNPVFAKRSIGGKKGKSNKKKKRASVMPVDREAMHEGQNDRKHLAPEYMNPETVEFHRMSRRGLYEKIERLIVG